jgi:hypothetical protein
MTRPGGRIVLTSAESIRPQPVRWLDADRVPSGAVTLVAGEPGLGKSTWTCDLAARASRGKLAGDVAHPIRVVMATAEDALAQVVVPRLTAAGADLGEVSFIHLERDGLTGIPTLPEHAAELREALRQAGAGLFVVDPFVAFLSANVNSYRDPDIRRAIAPLARLAEDLDLAVMLVVHLNKSTAAQIVARVSGSVGFTAAARSVLLFGRDPEDPQGPTRILVHAKSNLGPEAPALRFQLEGCTVAGDDENPIRTSRIVRLGQASGMSAARLLAPDVPTQDGPTTDRARALSVLRVLLADGPVAAKRRPDDPPDMKNVSDVIARENLPERAVDWAKEQLGIRSVKLSGWGSRWAWALRSSSILSSFGNGAGDGRANPAESKVDWAPSEEGQAASIFDDVPPPTTR